MSKMYIEYMYIIIYIYGSYSPELGEDIELFCVVQDFCLVTVHLRCLTSAVCCGLEWYALKIS